jgi:hypothetical protein
MTVRVCPICDIADCATHRPSTPPAIDPAAIREAALREAAEVAHELSLRWGAHSVKAAILALIGEKK